MGLTLVTAGVPVVDVSDMKDHLRVTGSDEDSIVSSCISAATAYAEQYMNRKTSSQTWKWVLDDYPYGDEWEMPHAPLISISSFEYYDESNDQQTWDSSNYRADTDSIPGRIEIIGTLPSHYDRVNAIEIEFVCGYTNVPEAIAQAIKLIATDLFENRQTEYISNSMLYSVNSRAARSLMDQYKLYTKQENI